ncbi:MAG: hypothetical protein AVDCRST_MAG56-3074 [uncultured Cytophagales bacterium]|uniref:Uncharacterized protein n=1 Tax=uncultured Cytophagales bacterium TaxID=158755 RepID=A0A6J4J914_9SPHI|nr:MAG: hypothetical protein AVDCRST_MAG56-3074 [uncultured Cytophagales bacterium]
MRHLSEAREERQVQGNRMQAKLGQLLRKSKGVFG